MHAFFLGKLARSMMAMAIGSLAFSMTRAETPEAAPGPVNVTWTSADEAFDLRLDLLKTDAAVFQAIEKEFASNPTPHVEARYAECLLGGKDWGAPDGQEDRGLVLAQDALNKGSVHALRIIGWELMRGGRLPRDTITGIRYLQQGAALQNANALSAIGDVYLDGVGGPVNLEMARYWYMKAAYYGAPDRLARLGRIYEVGAGSNPPDLTKACELFYEAASRGSGSAKKKLEELAKKGDPHAARASQLILLWYAAVGDTYNSRRVRDAVKALETNFPDDPKVLLAIGRMYQSENAGFRDFKKAYALFDRATQLGSADARCERARLLAEGYGVTKDQPRALAEWRILERNNSALACAFLGYYHYWGSLKDANLPKDAALAFSYSRRAADAGEYFGQANVAACYEFGIGTPIDYALAAKYHRTVAWRGSRYSQEKLQKLINHVTAH